MGGVDHLRKAFCLFSNNPFVSMSLLHHRPGQEEGNVPYVENSGFGKYSGNPDVIADTVCSWLASPELLESMKKAALEAARPHATLDIARDLAEIAFSTKQTSMTKEKELVAMR
jgi:UDP-N-acetylglucosamine:LPS N-acetylglucosamine transferase